MNTFLRDIRHETFQYYDALVAMMPKLMAAILVALITWLIARQIRRISDRGLKRQMEDPLLARFLANLLRNVIIIIGFSLALKTLGLGGITAGILAGAGITAFVIGFALRDIGENFLAGILMAFKRPFRVGDFVESGPIRGRVTSLNIRETQIKTQDGKDVFVPNANIIKNPLINFTVDGFLRYDVTVSLPDGLDTNMATGAIREAVDKVEGVLKKRKRTRVDITGLAPGRLDATVSFWLDNFKLKGDADQVKSGVIFAIKQAMTKLEKA